MSPQRIGYPVTVVAVACLVVSVAAGQQTDDATFLHVLLVGDTNDPEIGDGVRVDLQSMQNLLRTGVPAHRSKTTVLEGEAVSPDNIRNYYQNLRLRPTDSLLFFYAGHGAWDSKSHYLIMNSGQRVRRAEIRSAMEKRGARLNILLTDCCSTYTGQAAFFQQIVADPNLYRDLLFRHRGTVDITAAQRGELAIGNKLKGGYFTVALSDLFMHTPGSATDRNRDGVISWSEAAAALKKGTDAAFERMRPRGLAPAASLKPQTPHVFGNLAEAPRRPIPRSRHRFGVRVITNGGQVRVAEVYPATPAAWAGIHVGDQLRDFSYLVDDFRQQQFTFDKAEEFIRAVAAVPGAKVLDCTLQDPTTGKQRSVRLRLSQ